MGQSASEANQLLLSCREALAPFAYRRLKLFREFIDEPKKIDLSRSVVNMLLGYVRSA